MTSQINKIEKKIYSNFIMLDFLPRGIRSNKKEKRIAKRKSKKVISKLNRKLNKLFIVDVLYKQK